jgi:peptidyl-prolyl isomerase H (cyclophilin H)
MKINHTKWALWMLSIACCVAFALHYYDNRSILNYSRDAPDIPPELSNHVPEHAKNPAVQQKPESANEQRHEPAVGRRQKPQTQATKKNPTPPTETAVTAVAAKEEAKQFVFFDMAKQDFLKDPTVGKVIIELYPQYAPVTVKNFASLCKTKKYVNVPFHRIIQGFMIQGGDIVNQDGTGSYSIYGGENSTFEDEPFVLTHDQPGMLSMANSGPNTNGSQFFITLKATPHLDGKHVVFGKVVYGMEYVHDFEKEITDPNDRPVRKCYISNCGVWNAPIPKHEDDSLVADHPQSQMQSFSSSLLQQ